ncbi:hypothetical protein K0M31_015238 [Melipona bicolor]|uniref:Uncharacterized protein n=1 Tax=Melipona bicolor TaxID=60889 RepID=A0AA40KFH8_9HYME|nr:hypothetical protein K0M31_015238 [Melipona bicolor]
MFKLAYFIVNYQLTINQIQQRRKAVSKLPIRQLRTPESDDRTLEKKNKINNCSMESTSGVGMTGQIFGRKWFPNESDFIEPPGGTYLPADFGRRLPPGPFIVPEFDKFDNTGSSGHCRPDTMVGGGLFENAHNNADLAVECIRRTFHFPFCLSFLPFFGLSFRDFPRLFADQIVRITAPPF